MATGNRDAGSKVFRAGLIVFGVLTCLRVWSGPVEVIQAAHAQIPDAGAQRLEVVKQGRRTNELLQEILDTLRNETLKVEMCGTDNTKAPAVRVRKNRGR